MIVAGVTLLSVGVVALIGSALMEWKYKEPVYMIIAKLSVGIFAIGTAVLGIGMTIHFGLL